MKRTYILIVAIETTKLKAGKISCLYFCEIKVFLWLMKNVVTNKCSQHS